MVGPCAAHGRQRLEGRRRREEALAETRELGEEIDDIDQILEDIAKSHDTIRNLLKTLDAKSATHDAELAKLRAAPDVVQKAQAWEREFFAKQWRASGSNVSLDTYLAMLESEREMYRKRDEADDSEPISDARFNAQWRVVR